MNLKNCTNEQLQHLIKVETIVRDGEQEEIDRLSNELQTTKKNWERRHKIIQEAKIILRNRKAHQFLHVGQWYKDTRDININLLALLFVEKISKHQITFYGIVIHLNTRHFYTYGSITKQITDLTISNVQKLSKGESKKYINYFNKYPLPLMPIGRVFKIDGKDVVVTNLTRDEMVVGKIKHKEFDHQDIDWDPAMPEGNYR